jgi:hypothetical protein
MWLRGNWGKVVVAAVFLLVLAYVILVWYHGELGGKSTYAELQGIEVQHRSAPLADITALVDDPEIGLVIGVPTDDHMFPNAWIAATTTKPDGTIYEVVSTKARLRVSCARVHAFFDDPTRASIASAVREQIERQCGEVPSAQGS